MASKVLVYGAGGHGKVVADILLSAKIKGLVGFVDDNKAQGTVLLGLPVLGDSHWLMEHVSNENFAVVLGVGNNATREIIAERCRTAGIEVLTAIHPSAVIARSANVLPGAVVMAGAVINSEARIGMGAVVNTGAVVEHDVIVENYAQLMPNATMAGGARLGVCSILGAGAVILPYIVVGCRTTVGAGAVVVSDLPDHVIAIGVPAKVHRDIALRVDHDPIARASRGN
jgi:sugar O-acyltransferase (sialic acid O-acetyltransferase NeuD family)